MADDVVRIQMVVTYDIEVHDEREVVRAALQSHEAAAQSLPPQVAATTESFQRGREQIADTENGPYHALGWFIQAQAGWPEIPGAQILAVRLSGGQHDPEV
ncbi:MAG: hypothetical protein GEV00_04565 [Actinophytocola sp.]|nr:hypothetical protein [Actinophytocola sp.]